MPFFTIVSTSATQGSDQAEINTLSDEFANESEAVGYSRRMADELLGLAAQLSLDFDYSSVGVYDGDLVDQELEPDDPSFVGMWVLDETGVGFINAAQFRDNAAESPAPQ